MTFFDEVFSKLFGKKEASTAPLIHEPLSRSEMQSDQYADWIAANVHVPIIEDLSSAYHKKKLGIISPLEVHLLNTRYSNGFALSYDESIPDESFRNLFDYLKDRTLRLGYKLAQADRRILDKGDYEETIEKWYLKPDVVHSGKEFEDQRYGNVLMEHIAVDRKPSYIKLMVNVYQGRPYAEALPFDEFLDELFNLYD
ncbi:MAG: hypothetical protein HEP71_20495 [Roseivirga sp.]|nr:hypothetical protein [Roseivirga sp.]